MKQFVINLLRLLINIVYLLPVDKKLISIVSFHGDAYSCSPKYITEYLIKHYPDYKIVWAFKHPEQFIGQIPPEIEVVKYKSIKYIIKTVRAKVRINNAEEWILLKARPNQLVINTWHGGGVYKKVGRASTLVNENLSTMDYYNISNLFLSASKANSELMYRESFLYNGSIMEYGLPRNDILVNLTPEMTTFYKNKYTKDLHKKIILYAPTFREGDNVMSEKLNMKSLISALEEKFGGEWVIWIRGHLATIADNKLSDFATENCVDVSNVNDMQELLCAADVLITDYSSCMWDFSLTNKPIFLYAPDLEHYQNCERGFYYPIEEWGFSYATTNSELMNHIANYNQEQYINAIRKHHQTMTSFETGHATESIVDYIVQHTSI